MCVLVLFTMVTALAFKFPRYTVQADALRDQAAPGEAVPLRGPLVQAQRQPVERLPPDVLLRQGLRRRLEVPLQQGAVSCFRSPSVTYGLLVNRENSRTVSIMAIWRALQHTVLMYYC
jgi:hypothetical protein